MTVSTYQLCVLMLFNDKDKLSYSEIVENIVMKRMALLLPTPTRILAQRRAQEVERIRSRRN